MDRLRTATRRRDAAQADIARIRGLIEIELQRASRFVRQPRSLRGRIRALMADHRRHSTREVALALGITQEAAGDAMKRLARVREERLVRVRPGVYRRNPEWG
jgi:hypothetical protein